MGETAVDESMYQSEVRPESLCEKRPLEDGVKSDLANKKARVCGEVRPRVNVKRVAEIVLVLSTIGKLRAGTNPTPVEIKMMADAIEKLADVCKKIAPKDVFPRDAFRKIIEDLGLNRLTETNLGTRLPKMSISEKLQHTKQKMEKSEVFPLHSATYTPQMTQSLATSHAVRAFPSSKADHPPNSSSTVLHASPVSNSRTLPYHLGRHSTESPVQRAGRSHLRSCGKFNANSTGDNRALITHKEIGKVVEKILQAQITEHQKWSPPSTSRDYMNKPLTCQTCKTTITKVDTTLVCDACEKGYHLKCLHYIPKSFSRDERQEWHCGKCLSITNGKPKYGPVILNINTLIITEDQETDECNPKGNIVKTSENCNDVEWVGSVLNEGDERSNYSSCCINGTIYQLEDYALFTSNGSNFMPNKLHRMWEDNKTSEKRITVTRCFFPDDLPEGVGRPCAPESNEVYESSHETVLAAGLIHGPCEVLHPHKFAEEKVMQTHKPKPLFFVQVCSYFHC